MPPPKKAAKKVAKKAAKKAAGRHHEKHHSAKDLRRCYEHMGRLEVLQQSLKSSVEEVVAELTKMAQSEIRSGNNQDAADLLRASEHLCFASLAGDHPGGGRVSAELEHSISEEFEELARRADEQWEDHEESPSTLASVYRSARKSASRAFKDGAFYQALEFVRAAEALAHVKQGGSLKLDGGRNGRHLKGA